MLAVVCLEAGWVVTEVGRQPWTVRGLLLTRDAVTTSGNVWAFFTGALIIYVAVGAAAVSVLRDHAPALVDPRTVWAASR